MGFFHNTSIGNKTLIPPIIMVAALGVVLILGIYGVNKQQSVLSRVNELSLHRTTLVNEFISLSERVQSDLFRISVLRYMKLPDREIQPLHEDLEQELSDLDIIYGQILNKWPLDQGEKELLEKMKLPLDAFQRKTRQALAAVSKNPSFGILMVRSASVPFADFKRLLSQFLDYQKIKIAHAETASRETVETLKTTIIVIALFTAFIAILSSIWIGARLISRPVRAMTDAMGKLAGGELSAGVGDLNRKDEIGSMARAVEVFRKNAIEKRAAEEALRESEKKFRTLFDTSPQAIALTEMKTGKFIDVNDKLCRLTKYTKDSVIGRTTTQLGFYSEDDRNRFINELTNAGKVHGLEMDFKVKDGSIINTRMFAVPIQIEREVFILTSFYDVTDQKRLESQLQQATKMEAIATLAGGVAHDFNNALMGIMGNIELLRMELPEDEGRDKYFEVMKRSGHRMSRLTDQLLAYAQGGKYRPRKLKSDDFVIETLPILQHDLSPAVRVETVFQKDVSYIKADHTQMQMVLSCILANSNEAMEDEGLIKITVGNKDVDEDYTKQHPGLKPGPYVCLTIEDDGKGMDEETRSRIFEPFFTTKLQGQSRGMGMAAVYGIVKNHDGWIHVDSELGKGAVVRIYLPAVDVEVRTAEKPKIEPVKGAGTILVIEDEDVVIEVFQAMLENLGYRVKAAKTGKDAIHIIETFDGDIDLALLDIKLPDMDGGKVYPLIMQARPNLKVIVSSGYAIDGPAQKILDAGAQDFIQKPFSLATLSEKLKEALEGK